MATEAPPSYEDVVKKLDGQIGANPDAHKVLAAAKLLTNGEINILAINSDKMPPLSSNEKAVFTVGVAKAMSDPSIAEHLKQSAALASSACNNVETMFTNLTRELSAIDSKNTPPKSGPFTPKLNTLHQSFRDVVHQSKDLAVKIAVYGEQFESVIIPLCSDREYTVNRRKAKLEDFINDAEGFSADADGITTRFNKLKGDFGEFVGTFSSWAKDKEDADNKTLERLRNELQDLNSQLAKLNAALIAVGAVAAASLPATGVLAALAGPFAPLVMIAGLIVAGCAVATTVGLAIAVGNLQSEISQKQGQITKVTAEISEIKDARAHLEALGKDDLQILNDNISILSLLWTTVHNDALEIKQWLERGEKDTDMPEYMKVSLDHSVSIYQTMAVYLREYADGVSSANIPA